MSNELAFFLFISFIMIVMFTLVYILIVDDDDDFRKKHIEFLSNKAINDLHNSTKYLKTDLEEKIYELRKNRRLSNEKNNN